MTNEQKAKITEMRHNGVSYASIASALGISKETIKSFCRRNSLTIENPITESADYCRNCGVPIVQNPKTRKKVFCSAKCRCDWWKAHPQPIMNNSEYRHACANCGKSFAVYGRTTKKYCSHACYIAARFRKDDANE